jgi:D-aspartate ligase
MTTQVDTSTPAVVLKLDPNVLHHGGLGVIRSLGRIGVPVYGVHEGPLAPAASSRYLAGRFFWQPGSADSDRIRDGLIQLAGRIGRPAVLLPTDDAGAIFLAEHGTDMRPWFTFPDPPRHLPRQVAGKYSLHELCRRLGVPSPAAELPESAAAARDFAARAGYPLIAKLTTPWQDGKLRSTSIVTSPGELDRAYEACARAGAGLMLQEFIPGGAGTDWFFHGYCDAASACRPAFTGVKDRSYPAHAGLTSLGRAQVNPVLRDQVTGLLSEIGYQGILDMDWRLDRRDGQYKLLDFNPRLGAQFRLFQTTAGLDVATAAYLDLTGADHGADHGAAAIGSAATGDSVTGDSVTGDSVTGDSEQAERRFLVENYDPLGALGYWRRGELSPKAWLKSLRAVDEVAWFARDDLAPFGLMCLRMGWRLMSRPVSRLSPLRRRQERAPDAGIRFAPGRAARAVPVTPGPATPGPATPRPATPRPATRRPATPRPATRRPGPATPVTPETEPVEGPWPHRPQVSKEGARA